MLVKRINATYGTTIFTIRNTSNITYDIIPTVTCSNKVSYEGYFSAYTTNKQPYIRYEYHDHNMECFEITNIGSKPHTEIGLFTPITNVKCIQLTKWNVSQIKGVETWFNNCKFINVFISDWKFGPITDISQMFIESERLITASIRRCDAPNITNMDKLFYSCPKLYSVDITNNNIPNLTSMHGMFSYCPQLKIITIDADVVNNVVDMAECFKECRSLDRLNSNWKLTQLQYIDEIFYGCTNIRVIDLSSWDLSKVASFNRCFKNCGASHITFNNTVKSYVMSAIKCFEGCQRVNKLDLSMWDVSNLVDMSGCFRYCHNLTALNISTWKFDVNANIDVREAFLHCEKLKYVCCQADIFLYFLLNGAFGDSYEGQWEYDASEGVAYKVSD